MPPAISRAVAAVQGNLAQVLVGALAVPLVTGLVTYGGKRLAAHDEQLAELDKRATLVEAGRQAGRQEFERRLAETDRRVAAVEENGRRDAVERAKLREDVAVLIANNAGLLRGMERVERMLERLLPTPTIGGR